MATACRVSNGHARPANASTGQVPAWERPARCVPPRHRLSTVPAPSDARGPMLEGRLAQRWNPGPKACPCPFRGMRRQPDDAGYDARPTAAPVHAPANRTSRQTWPRDAHGRDRAWPERARARSTGEKSPGNRRPSGARGSRRARHRWPLGSNHPRVHPDQKRADDTAASGGAIKTAFCNAGSCARSSAGPLVRSKPLCGNRYSRRRPRLARNA